MDDAGTLRFGSFTLDHRRRELRRGDAPVTIGSRALDLLCALVACHGELATKDTLMAAVWPRTVVDENNLAAQVVALRKVLSTDPTLARCVQTVPGRGYRFVAEVTVERQPSRASTPSDATLGLDGHALSLVVLPFASLSDDRDHCDFAQGLSHTTATDLSRIAGLVVIAPTTAAALEGRGLDPRQVSRELSVDYVLTGSVQRGAGQLRINAHLVEGSSGRQVWSERFDGEDRDLLAFQDRITGRIANSIGREIFVAAARGGAARDVDPTSFDLLMRGIAADNRPQSLESLRQQETLFDRAVQLDPLHAEAHARLARAILLQITQVHAATHAEEALLARGVAAAETAMALAPENPRAQCAMGLVHVVNGEFERAVIANQAAVALDPNFAIAHNNLGNSWVHVGAGAEALPAAEAALRLDPRGPQVGAFLTTKGFACLCLGALEEARASFLRAQSANPLLPRAHVGAALALALGGNAGAAQEAVRTLLRLVPTYRLSQTMDGLRPASSTGYRRFFEEVLRPASIVAGLPP